MPCEPQSNQRFDRVYWILFGVIAITLLSGCQSVGYYAQAVSGHCQIVSRQTSVDKLAANTNTPPELIAKLQLARELCDFAQLELGLPANGNYRKYADLERPYVVWNVYAAPTFSVESKNWWYPFVGKLDYRGYFAEKNARHYAEKMQQREFDVYVEGVEAYSTLGWFKDPLLNTFLDNHEAVLAEIIFHELAHQCVFARGDTDFNEAFATAVGQEGARRWLASKADAESLKAYEAAVQRERQFVQLALETRSELRQLFESQPATKDTSTESLKSGKAETLDRLQQRYRLLRKSWNGYSGYDAWFSKEVNNARLNSLATYFDLVPNFEELLASNDHNLTDFYAEAERLSHLKKNERHRQLQEAASHQNNGDSLQARFNE